MSNNLVLSEGTRVGNVNYSVMMDKSTGKLTLTAKNDAGSSRTISVFANGSDARGREDAFDNTDRVTIKGDSSIEFDVGVLRHVLNFIHNKKYANLNAEQYGEAQVLNQTFNPTEGNRQVNTLSSLGKNTEIAYKQATGQPTSHVQPVNNGLPMYGGPFYQYPYTQSTQKPLSPRAQEYQNKLSQLTSELNGMRSWYQRLVNYYPTVLRDCNRIMNQLNYCGDFSMFAGYVSAGNGTPGQMVYKYQAKINELSQALMSYSGALAKLDKEYADVADEVRTETTNYPGYWINQPTYNPLSAPQNTSVNGWQNGGGFTLNPANGSTSTQDGDSLSQNNENDDVSRIGFEEINETI